MPDQQGPRYVRLSLFFVATSALLEVEEEEEVSKQEEPVALLTSHQLSGNNT